MAERYVGFYWTLPVRFAGFINLPSDAEKAAEVSTTIRYQRLVVRRWIEENGGGEPIREFTFLELQDDRGSSHIQKALQEAADFCLQNHATLLLIGFEMNQHRRHARRNIWIRGFFKEQSSADSPDGGLKWMFVPADTVWMDDDWFDPALYFERRRKKNLNDLSNIRRRADHSLRNKIGEMPSGPKYYGRIAELLNRESVRTSNGGSWTNENVKKAIRSLKIVDKLREALALVPDGPEQDLCIANHLNEEGIKHYSGGIWTADKVRVAIKRKLADFDPDTES